MKTAGRFIILTIILSGVFFYYAGAGVITVPGYGSGDATRFLQAALDSLENAGGTLHLDAAAEYIISSGLTLSGTDSFTIDGHGSTIRMMDGIPAEPGNHLFKVVDASHFTIRNLVLDGNRNGRIPREIRAHSFTMLGCRRFLVENVRSDNAVCDGFNIRGTRSGDSTSYSADGCFKNCGADFCYRQGMSIIHGRRLRISGCSFTNTRGTWPMAGIDIEANRGSVPGGNHSILIDRCVFSGNDGYGVQLANSHKAHSISVEYCYFTDNGRGGVKIATARSAVRDNVFEDFFRVASEKERTRGIVDIPAANGLNCCNIVSDNVFRKIRTGGVMIYIHRSSGGSHRVTGNCFEKKTGRAVQSFPLKSVIIKDNRHGGSEGCMDPAEVPVPERHGNQPYQ